MAGMNPTTADNYRAIVPSDTVPQNPLMRGIYCGGAGNVVVQSSVDNTDVTFAVNAGQALYIEANLIKMATTATGLIALF